VKKGDHVIPLYTPECRQCKSCCRARPICARRSRDAGKGVMPDGTSRFSIGGKTVHHYMGCSTFSNYTVLPEIRSQDSRDAPFEKVLLHWLRCQTGVERPSNTAKVEPGERGGFGLGGIGLKRDPGAHMVGANRSSGGRQPRAAKKERNFGGGSSSGTHS